MCLCNAVTETHSIPNLTGATAVLEPCSRFIVVSRQSLHTNNILRVLEWDSLQHALPAKALKAITVQAFLYSQ